MEEIEKKNLSDGAFKRGKYFKLRQKQKQTVSTLHSSKRSAQCAKKEQRKENKLNNPKLLPRSEGTANLLYKFSDEPECFARPVGSGTHN